MNDPTVAPASVSPWARACHALAGHPVFGIFGSRRNRRLLVIGFALVLAAMPLVGWLTDRVWAVLVLFVPFAIGALVLAGANHGLFDRPVSRLDERERQLRQSIFGDPYAVGATFGLLAGMATVAALDRSDAVMMGILVPVVSGLYLIPGMVLAWKTPDEVDDEG